MSGNTGSDGRVLLNSPRSKSSGIYTFTVESVVAAGHIYNATLNLETSDSIVVP